MEEKVDNYKRDMNNLSLTRPTRIRKQKKFDDYVVSQEYGPSASSTPIKRDNLQKPHEVKSPGTDPGLFSPSTDLNLTLNQSSIQYVNVTNSTSEISYNTSQHQTWSEHSLTHLKSAEKRNIFGHDTAVDSPTPVKRKRGRPRKINSASNDQSSELLVNCPNPADDDKEKAMEKGQEIDIYSRLNETNSSFQEEDNLVVSNSTSILAVKKRRGRPRKHSNQNNNNQMNDSHSNLHKIEIQDGSLGKMKDEICGNGRYAAAEELSTRHEGGKGQGEKSPGSPVQEPDNLRLHENTVSGSSVKRHRGRPKRYSPTQFKDKQMEDSSIDPALQAEGGISGKNKVYVNLESSTCGEIERRFDDAHHSNHVVEQERDNIIVKSEPASISSVIPGTVMVTKRGRGRPRKHEVNPKDLNRGNRAYLENGSNARKEEYHLNENHQDTVRRSRRKKFDIRKSSESEASSSDEDDDRRIFSSRGRGRGRMSRGRGRPSRGRGRSSRGRGQTSRGRGQTSRGRGRGNSSSTNMTPSGEMKCAHCELLFQSLQNYKEHLMSRHSLVYTPEEPQGVNSPYIIVKKMGYIDCQKCGRRFKSAQYYGHHIVWCGRETETYVCPICKRETRSMWEKHHNRMHAQKEQARAQEEKNKEEDLKSKKMKRKAACNAMAMLNNLEQGTDEATVVSSGENTTISEEQDEDDTEDETLDKGEKDIIKKGGGRNYPANYSMWLPVCKLMGRISHSEKLNHLRKCYDGAGQGRLFPELSPISENWKILCSREREKYLPHLKQSPTITSFHKKSNGTETFTCTLSLGEQKCDSGKAFCYTGGPIWAMEWCPKPVAYSQEQMLAIASDIQPGHHLYVNKVAECPNILQFWSVRKEKESKEIFPRLDFCIAHDSGYVRSLSWCPMGCFDEIDSQELGTSSSQKSIPSQLPRLGLLSMACSDASILIFSLPHPSSIGSLIQSTADHYKPIIVKPKPSVKLVPNSRTDMTPCLAVSWQNSDRCERIIGGYGRGEVLMWTLASRSAMALEDIKTLHPIRVFLRHKSSVVTCAWCPTLPHFFVSCDYSGFIYLWNSNRPLEPESALKKTNTLITKAICMAGPLHWGFFAANDKLCIPDPHHRISDKYLVNFFGFSPQCLLSVDFHATVSIHSVCTWDVTFDPVFNILVTCDAAGNVRLALLHEENLLTTSRDKIDNFPKESLKTLLYKFSVTPEDKDAKKKTSLPTADGKEAHKVQQSHHGHVIIEVSGTNCCKEGSEGESSVPLEESGDSSKKNTDERTSGTENLSVTREMDPKSPVQNEKAPDDLHFQYHELGEGLLRKKKAREKGTKCNERENFGSSNLESIQRVRLCPGMDTNLWLASGGNAGILRFDSLYDLVIPHSWIIERELNQLEGSTKPVDS